MLTLLLAILGELAAPLPSEPVAARHGDILRLRMPVRAALVAAALGLATSALVLFAGPPLLAAMPKAVAWASDTSSHQQLLAPRGLWGAVASLAGLAVTLRFLNLYARALVAQLGEAAAGCVAVHYTLADPRAKRSR